MTRSQFDFILNINNLKIILECDGDYWHKSSRRCSDIGVINIKRNQDKLKEKFMIDKEFLFIRFWEYNINNNLDIIENFLLELKSSDINSNSVIENIKEYYIKNS